jgi:hypothetical protein
VVGMVSAGRRGERGECGGGDGECGLEGASEVSAVVGVMLVSAGRSVVVSAGRRGRAR